MPKFHNFDDMGKYIWFREPAATLSESIREASLGLIASVGSSKELSVIPVDLMCKSGTRGVQRFQYRPVFCRPRVEVMDAQCLSRPFLGCPKVGEGPGSIRPETSCGAELLSSTIPTKRPIKDQWQTLQYLKINVVDAIGNLPKLDLFAESNNCFGRYYLRDAYDGQSIKKVQEMSPEVVWCNPPYTNIEKEDHDCRMEKEANKKEAK